MSAAMLEMDLDDLRALLGGIVANEYLRVSHDASGVLRSPAEQHAEDLDLCSRKRWTLGRTYQDEGSASQFATKERDEFLQMVEDLRRDAFGAQLLIIWEVSRGTRRPGEMEELLLLCQRRGVWIYVVNKRRAFNPSVVDDWEDLMVAVVKAAGESMRTSQRVKRASRADATAGAFTGGRRPYGYEADGVTIRESEAYWIREAARLLLGGKSVRWIAGELNRQGVPTPAWHAPLIWRQWHPGPLGKLLASQRVAGHRVHDGVVVKRDAWDAILDADTHARVAAVLATRSPTGRRGRTPWMLTGLLRCGATIKSGPRAGETCGALLLGNTDSRNGVRRYVCRSGTGFSGCGGLGIAGKPLEDLLGALASERLADAQARHEARVTEDDAAERAELDRITAQRAVIARELAAGTMDREDATLERAELKARQKAAERSLAAKARDQLRLDFIATEDYVGRSWAELNPSDQRVVLDALLDHVTVTPTLRRGTTKFEAERVRGGIAWKA